jgi:hypothetical protein
VPGGESLSLCGARIRDRAAHCPPARLDDQRVSPLGVLMLCIFRQHGVGGCATLPFIDDDQMSRQRSCRHVIAFPQPCAFRLMASYGFENR